MDKFIQWIKDHSTPILVAGIAVAKAGVFGKILSALVLAIAAAAGSPV